VSRRQRTVNYVRSHPDRESHRYCPDCDEYRLKGEFGTEGARLNRRCLVHAREFRLGRAESRRRSPERAARLLRVYGMGDGEYEALLESQGGGCAICGATQNEAKKLMPVDHCHKTGRVRGILCFRCNTGIGHFKESADLLLKAADYLMP
jgi:hypothetical protein